MEEKKSLERRDFLRKAAITGAAAAWAAPIVQTVAATPAFATGTPAPCPKSDDPNTSCMSRCQDSGGGGCGSACQNQCANGGALCTNGVCVDSACDPTCWSNCTYVC